MNFATFMGIVERAARRMRVTESHDLAMLLASAHIESKARDDAASILAFLHNNLFGFWWLEGDAAKGYTKVTMPPNQYDPQDRPIFYRGYESYEHCIQNWLWHREKSRHYRDLAAAAHIRLSLEHDPAKVYAWWTRALGDRWQKGNPNHGETVEQLYWDYLKNLKERKT